jgi:uncharacterized membrane protein YkoI
MKKILCIVLAVFLAGALAAGFFIRRHQQSVIGRDRALEIALADAGLSRAEVHDVDVDYESENGYARYEVSFEQGLRDYEYGVDAKTGQILYGGVER